MEEKKVEWGDNEEDDSDSGTSETPAAPAAAPQAQLPLDIHQEIEVLGVTVVEHVKAAVALRYLRWKRAP